MAGSDEIITLQVCHLQSLNVTRFILGDWIADVAVSKAGFSAMAISSTFGSPLLNCVIGIGMSLTYYCLSHFPQAFVFNFSDEKYDQVFLEI